MINDNNPRIANEFKSYKKYNESEEITEDILFDKPSTMTFDLSDFLYVVTSGNHVVRINPGNGEAVFSFTAGNKFGENQSDQFNFVGTRGQVTAIDAMSCDSDNNLLVANNADSKLYTFKVHEDLNQHPYPPREDNHIYEWRATTGSKKFLQGSGDWTGIRWIQTYLKTVMGQRELIGTKNVDVYTLDQNEILKVNEDHDPGLTLESYTLQETINTKDNLLKWFMGTIVGTDQDFPDTLGKVVYEKISNFVSNNNDLDVCNAKNLFSMANELGVDVKSYDYAYPGSIQRLVDLLSIRYKKLFGERDQTGASINKSGYADNPNYGRNISSNPIPIDLVQQYELNVGDKLIARELYSGETIVIDIMAIPGEPNDPNYDQIHGGVTKYSLGDYDKSWNWGLSHPDDEAVWVYYDFYQYVPDTIQTEQLEGVVNWSDPNITINETTTYDDWSKDQGVVESLFDKKMRIGIGVTK